jgi:uncharacterized protein
MQESMRFAAISRLVHALGDIGKTKLQKLVYFVQEECAQELGYRFGMHHFGPYSDELDDDMVKMKAFGYLRVEPDAGGYGYHVMPGSEKLPEFQTAMIASTTKTATCIQVLGHKSARDLELWATIHYLTAHLEQYTYEQIESTTRALKPKFAASEIRRAHAELAAILDTLRRA